MNVVPVLVGFSLLLAISAVALFVYSARNRDHEHADRLSLLPLEDDLSSAASNIPSRAPREEPTDD